MDALQAAEQQQQPPQQEDAPGGGPAEPMVVDVSLKLACRKDCSLAMS